MTDCRWENLLKPIKSVCANGSVILVTTRDVSVAKMTGTTEQIKLVALDHDEFRLLFKFHAFGDENYVGDQNLSKIGQKIADKLKGNPLAAESTGKVLRKKLNTDHWDKILKDEHWKSLQLSRGIMPALKLSYDQLPYHSQQCFAYCSIFPDGYQFLVGELALIWISQGFVKGNHSSKILEEIERNYLTPLVNMGFFQQVEREESSPGNQTYHAVCGLMHDFARIVLLTQCATIDGLQCNKIPPTIRHLSIVTGSEYRKDEHGNIPRNEKFEKNMRDTVTSVSKLRSLVLLGHYDSFFLQLFQDIFEKAHDLHLLQMSARSADFPKCGYDKVDGALPRVLSKLYHLRVLNIGSYTDPTIPDGINNLVSLQQLVVHKGVYSSIATIDSMTSFQEPHGVNFQISSGFEITQLQSTDESAEHYMHVKTLEEAYEAVLRNSELSEKLILSWKETADIGMELERLEPRPDVKYLQISGWPESNILTSFQTVYIGDCDEWKILPSLGRFLFLTKLMLSYLEEVKEILVPSLEELVLIHMPRLERCSCTSVEGMNSRLRALQIEECKALKQFDLFENDDIFEIEQRSWLPGLRKLILRDCPHLKVLNPLPPSTTCSELVIAGVSILPSMEGAFSEELRIGYFGDGDGDDDDDDDYDDDLFDDSSDYLRILDDKILAFHNLRNLESLTLDGCRNLMSISFEGFCQLDFLKFLKIYRCKKLFCSDVMSVHAYEDVTAANYKAFPSLESLSIHSCGIAGKWLSLMLRQAPGLTKLSLKYSPLMTLLSTEEEENSLPKLITAREVLSSGNPEDAPTGLVRDKMLQIPLNLLSSLTRITIKNCPSLTFNRSKKGFSGFTSLEDLTIHYCSDLLSSLVYKDGNDDRGTGRWLLPTSLRELHIIDLQYSEKTLQPCFPSDLTSLRMLEVWGYDGLESLQLHSCTALEVLMIQECESLTTLEGSQSLGSLRHLAVSDWPGLLPCWESLSRQGYQLFPRLEKLDINDPSVLTTAFCNHLTSLQRLQLERLVLTEEQGSALVLLTSLQQLEFDWCSNLVDLPAGLHLLPSLKRLKISWCRGISRLLEKDLPHSLEEVEIAYCLKELADHCRLLATSKLNVIIYGCTY